MGLETHDEVVGGDGKMLDYPLYKEPAVIEVAKVVAYFISKRPDKVPEVLLCRTISQLADVMDIPRDVTFAATLDLLRKRFDK